MRIVSLSLIVTLVVYPSLATHSSLATMLVSVTMTTATGHVISLIGESAAKMSYDSGISSGPPGGMFSSSKLCCALFGILPLL